MTETILAIGAHNDDHIIGAGATLAKYSKQGKRVKTVVFSFGEFHPYKRKEIVIEERMKEFLAGDKIMGGSGVAYFGCRDGKVEDDIKEKNIEEKLAWLIQREKPSMIFTHGFDDAHPDHKAVHRLVMKLIEKKKIKCPVYSFDVWSLIKIKKRNLPRLVVDVSDTFPIKIKTFLAHESQKVVIWALLWKIIVKDWFSGLINGHRYAEVFYRIQ